MKVIKPTYVTFEQAKLLKEKGFDIHMSHYYFEDSEFKEHSLKGSNGYYGDEYEVHLSQFNENWNNKWLTKKSGDRCFGCSKDRGYFETYSAPEQWQVVEWLRINHGIWVDVFPHSQLESWWCAQIYKGNNIKDFKDSPYKGYKTPQEAYSAAIDYILKELI